MSKAYMCDCCGKAIVDPHEIKMKEFYIAAECDMCGVFPVNAKRIKKIHLCDVCFSQLRYVAKVREIEEAEEKLRGLNKNDR